jgi:hypothetical protein
MAAGNVTVRNTLVGVTILGAVLAASSYCSTSHRGDDPDSDDTDSDSDTGIVVTSEPIQIANTENIWVVASSYSGTHLAVGWANPDQVYPYGCSMELAFLPWLDPEQIVHKHSVQTFSQYERFPFSQLFSTGGGFLVLTYSGNPTSTSWAVEQSTWGENGDLADGFHLHEGYEGYHFSPASGAEDVDQDGRVLIATLSGSGAAEDFDYEILFAVDRFGPEGFRETIVSEVFDWSEQAAEAGPDVGNGRLPWGSTFKDGDRVVAFNVSGRGSVVFAQASLEGEVLVAPRVAASPPADYPGPLSKRQPKGASFARKGDRVLGIVNLFADYDGHCVRHFSALFDIDGNLLEGPHDLAPLQGGVLEQDTSFVVADLVSWGDRFAYCYHTSVDGSYHLLMLDENGHPLADPFLLAGVSFLAGNAACVIEVVDEATLAIIVAVAVYPNSILNGPYLVVVTDPGLQ